MPPLSSLIVCRALPSAAVVSSCSSTSRSPGRPSTSVRSKTFELQLLGQRLVLGVADIHGGLQRFARHVDRPHRAHADGKALGGQHEIDLRVDVALGQLHGKRQDLRLAVLAGRQSLMWTSPLASVVAVCMRSPASW